jgi:hypothetical protein
LRAVLNKANPENAPLPSSAHSDASRLPQVANQSIKKHGISEESTGWQSSVESAIWDKKIEDD